MRFRIPFYSLLFLISSCNFKQPDTSSASLPLPTPSESFTHNEPQVPECVVRLDSDVEIFLMTEALAIEMQVMDRYLADPGFDKWCVLFHDIPDNPPYEFQQNRVAQLFRGQFFPCGGPPSERIIESKKSGSYTGLIVSARGYLPGEKITIRLASQGAYKDAVFYPRPLSFRKKTGEILGKVTLLSAQPGECYYELDLAGIQQNESYTLVSRSGDEVISHEITGPIMSMLLPEVLGLSRGVARIELQFNDGCCSHLELPWGYELLEYKIGNK